MLELDTPIEGKLACFGPLRDKVSDHGYHFGGGWDYNRGHFDSILSREGGETIYLRVPFVVHDGELDDYNTYIKFKKPYVIKHVVNTGLDRNASSLLSGSFNQFQEPVDKDAGIRDKSRWETAGELAIEDILQYLE
ncbi:YugN family protein [Sporosarcina sp. GW1-11]|uniref:YugN family protein n=1 Tax=Sporosarcina sp. GW1-11 TaxID=2899126 RepID=UPI00294DB042|nr:YugN family protein [Sporosarcina sp. GW1-11]MDV6377791.1 YugN family protein [Sporosarcina sp. GW1-11]